MEKEKLEDLRQRKKELGYTFERLAQVSGVPLGTIQKIFNGETRDPRPGTLQALEKYLYPEKRYSVGDGSLSFVREEAVAYGASGKRQGEYTVEDYLSWPEDQRIELIDGRIYDMAGPVFAHQIFLGEFHYRFKEFIKRRGGSCIPFMAPVDVQLDCDDKTVVQPDVGILCDRDKLKNGRVFGAPDLLVEIISPSSRRNDLTLKLAKYENAGVREYWIVDMYRQIVLTYFFEAEDYPVMYGFDDRIPVRIYDGALEIDMREMKEIAEEEDWR